MKKNFEDIDFNDLTNWLKIVTGLGTTNQSALFQNSFTTPKFVYDIGSSKVYHFCLPSEEELFMKTIL